ncbi:hypothetical protein D3C76_912310 [compost metagenome]
MEQVIDQIGIGYGIEGGCLKIFLELLQHILRIIHEIEHKGALLAGIGAVEARKGLDAIHSCQLLVHIHGTQLGLIETGLKLVGHQHHLIVLGIECLTHVPPIKLGVHVPLVKTLPFLFDVTRERHHGTNSTIALLCYILVERQLVTNRLQPTRRHNHRLGLPSQEIGHVGAEMLNDDRHFLADIVRV